MFADPDNGPLILFVEDEDGIADPFSSALHRAGFRTIRAANIRSALAQLNSVDPDLILLDLTLPDGDGRDVAVEARRQGDTPIIMLTARGTEADRVIGLETGADDYVVKPFSSAEVIARIRAVLRRSASGQKQPPEPVEIGDLRIDPTSRQVTVDGITVELTRKEFDLLALLAAHEDEVLSRETIMSEIWDTNWFGSTKTLDVHVSSLRRKLGEDPANLRYLHTVRGVGLRLADERAA